MVRRVEEGMDEDDNLIGNWGTSSHNIKVRRGGFGFVAACAAAVVAAVQVWFCVVGSDRKRDFSTDMKLQEAFSPPKKKKRKRRSGGSGSDDSEPLPIQQEASDII